jgi:predicted DNA-binding transcriptional regulator AlpA
VSRSSHVLEPPSADPKIPQRDPQAVHGVSQLLTGPQVRERLGISRWTWDAWMRQGKAPAPVPNIPGHPRWFLADIERFERGKHGTTGREFFGAARRGR